MKHKNLIKILGILSSIAGVGVTLLSDWVMEKNIETMVDEKVNEAFNKNKESE